MRILTLILYGVLTAANLWAGEPIWTNVTNDLGGDVKDWGKFAALTLGAAPSTDTVYVHVGSAGFFASTDGGAHWANIAPTGTSKIDGFVGKMLFDPKAPNTFWVTCWYGKGLLKTADGGKIFELVGKGWGLEGVSVDFADPDRKTIVVGGHEKGQSLQLSQDGGATWKPIGQNLPADTNFSCWPVLLGPTTILTNTSGASKKLPNIGIWRSEDAGETWTKVSDLAPTGPPLVTAKRDVFYPVKKGLARSTDNGKTWAMIQNGAKGPVTTGPIIELPDGRLAGKGFGGGHIELSSDNGDTWTAVGPPLPANATGFGQSQTLVYLPKMKAFMICVGTYQKKIPDAIWRLDLPNL